MAVAPNTRFLEGELVLPEEGYCANMYQYVPICTNIASQQFRFANDRSKGACIFVHINFFRNFEHLKQLKELNGVDKLGTELEIAQN